MDTLKGEGNFRLEDLNVSKNGLTTAVLPFLAQVVEMSTFDLRTLDLSYNNISVITNEHARLWGRFLDSFRTARVMRRLDLSRNDFSKSLAMEVFCRVYFSHRPIDPNELEGSAPIDDDMASTRELHGAKLIEKTNSLTMQSLTDPFFDPSTSIGSLSDGVILKRREGLRAIPYILLCGVNMTDAGVLHFSYILEHHYWPQYLMAKLREGSHAANVQGKDDSLRPFGVIYNAHDRISTAGQKLLSMVEQARLGLAGISEMSHGVNDTFEDPVEFYVQ